ncbi:MAG: hypothetical protein M5U19_11535 [Microthrixaceae bacterium]|nr:hypothetical protein [Microthrixaceae bacterium]
MTLVSDGYHNRRLLGIASELDMAATVSPSTSRVDAAQLGSESLAVAVGEVVGFRRLDSML